MKTNLIPIACAALLAASASTGAAQQFALDQVNFGGGGSAGSAGPYSGSISIGQPIATGPASAGEFSFSGGFWAAAGTSTGVTNIVVSASQTNVAEGASVQLAAVAFLDDGTNNQLSPSVVTWSVISGPILHINSSGLAMADRVYQNSPAIVRGDYAGKSATLTLAVINTSNDDFGIYAGDGIPDDWQVQNFGLNNPNGLAQADPDADGQNNFYEYNTGTDPNDPASRFFFTIANVPGQPKRKLLAFGPRLPGRTYTVQTKTNLSTGNFSTLTNTLQSDLGTTRSITDTNAGTGTRFYRVSIALLSVPYGTNLLMNGDAEAGAPTTSGNAVVPVPGWTTSGNFTVPIYGIGNSSTADLPLSAPGPANRGTNFFAGGPNGLVSSASQTVDLTAAAAQIDSVSLQAELSGWLGGWQSQYDSVTLLARFVNALGDTIGQASLGPVLPADRGGVSSLLLRGVTNALPIGTRQARISLNMTRTDGNYNDAYADNISLIVRPANPPGAAHVAQPPMDQWVATGSNATFIATATGTPPLAYQWLFNGTNLPGATSNSLVVANASTANAGIYSVCVTNSLAQNLSSNATLYVFSPQSLLNTNLIVNPGAEAGSSTSSGSVVPVPGWTTNGGFTVLLYNSGFGVPITVPGPTNRGTNCFAGGPNTTASLGSQLIHVEALRSLIDGGQVSAELTGWLGGFLSDGDNATLIGKFLDGGGDPISQFSIGPVTASDRTNTTCFLFRGATNTMPAFTRSIQLNLSMIRTTGNYCDAYADNLSLILRSIAP